MNDLSSVHFLISSVRRAGLEGENDGEKVVLGSGEIA